MHSRSRRIIRDAVILIRTAEPFLHHCDLCKKALPQLYFDAADFSRPWAFMCPECFWRTGSSLGLGKGQLFIRVDSTEVSQPA